MFKFRKTKSDKKFNENKKDEFKYVPKDKIAFKARFVNNTKLLMKDLKRTRWVKIKDSRKTFLKIAIFVVIVSLILFGIAIAFSSLWKALGVGLND